MDLVESVKEAEEIVDKSGVDKEFRGQAFTETLRFLLARTGTASAATEPPSPESTSGLNGLASRLEIKPAESAAQLFFLEDDRFELVVSPSKLDATRSRATEQIALLVAAARQGAGLEEWTPTHVIREWCEHYKRLDTGNFAATLRGMHDVFSFRGSGRDRSVRMTAPAWQKAARLVGDLLGDTST